MNLQEAEKTLETIIDKEGLINPQWISSKGYVGVVAPTRISNEKLKRIILYCETKEIKQLYYLPANEEAKSINYIKPRIIEAKTDSLLQAELDSFTLGDRAIFPENLSFFVQTDGDYYHIVTGTEELIQSVFNSNNMIQEYINYLNSLSFEEESSKDFLYSFAKRYPGKHIF